MTFSEDGNWYWNGSEWIPAPPADSPNTVSQPSNSNPRGNWSRNWDEYSNVKKMTMPEYNALRLDVRVAGYTDLADKMQEYPSQKFTFVVVVLIIVFTIWTLIIPAITVLFALAHFSSYKRKYRHKMASEAIGTLKRQAKL